MHIKSKLLISLGIFSIALAANATDITGAGSSAAKPLYTLWSDFYGKTVNAKLRYQPVGSSAGIKQIEEKEVDFGASDVTLPIEDLKNFKLICFPSAISGVVPVVNLPGVKAGELQLTGELLAGIFSRKITRWNDAAIAAVNPGVALPKDPIVAVVRQDGSGTTYNFTDYLSKVSRFWKDAYGKNFTIAWPADTVQVKGSVGIVDSVRQTVGAIGYVDYNYVMQDRLIYVKVKNREGKFVSPNGAAFASALNNSSWKNQDTFEDMLTDRPGIHSWPITMGTFVIVSQTAKDPKR